MRQTLTNCLLIFFFLHTLERNPLSILNMWYIYSFALPGRSCLEISKNILLRVIKKVCMMYNDQNRLRKMYRYILTSLF